MPGWAGSNRLNTLPPDWQARRRAVAERAGWRCQADDAGFRCGRLGTDCDHVNDRDDHSLSNLQWLCRGHHNQKTIASRTPWHDRRASEAHPGMNVGE